MLDRDHIHARLLEMSKFDPKLIDQKATVDAWNKSVADCARIDEKFEKLTAVDPSDYQKRFTI